MDGTDGQREAEDAVIVTTSKQSLLQRESSHCYNEIAVIVTTINQSKL